MGAKVPRIDGFRFGTVTVDGREYRRDVIIRPDGVRDGWWRREGHSLFPEDLIEALGASPEVLVVGCGASGLMRVPEETASYVRARGVDLLVLPTAQACRRYNELAASKRTVACLHLTC